MSAVVVVDYGMCNLDSVCRAFEECGASVTLAENEAAVRTGAKIVLPGVGAFPEAMHNLRCRGLESALTEQVIGKQVPFLGICLGMQMLATTGMEEQATSGLGWIDGNVMPVEASADDRRLPHIGWNEVQLRRPSRLFDEVPSGKDFYFVHGYRIVPSHDSDVVGWTDYGTGFVSAVERDWIFGVQFHPEKSQKPGFQVIRNFLRV